MIEYIKVEPAGGETSRGVESDPDGMNRLMEETLERGLSQIQGRPVRIRELRREACEHTTSFQGERLSLSLEGGEPVRVFFKDLNPEHQTQKAQKVRKPDATPSCRELEVYQSILSRLRLGTPQLYAVRWEPERGIYWLFLEDTGSSRLRECRNFARWVAAAAWAARFHAATLHLPDSAARFLPRYDYEHYRQCVSGVQKLLPNLEARDREIVSRGLECYENRLDWFTALPCTVIHGQFFGKNVMLRKRNPEHRIAVIDWETAAIGPGAFDLVSLSAGNWTKEQRLALWRAYFEQYQADAGCQLDWDTFCLDLGGVSLYHALGWLAWWQGRGFSHNFGVWVKELDRVLREHFAAY